MSHLRTRRAKRSRGSFEPVWIALAIACGASTPAMAATAIRLTADPAASSTPAVSYGLDGEYRVAWSDTRDGNAEIYYARVDPWGNRRTPDVRVSFSPGTSSTLPRIGVDASGFAYLCWREGSRVAIAKLDRPGNVVVAPTLVDLGFNHVVGQNPDIAVLPDGRFAVSLGAQHSGINETFVVNYSAALGKLCQTSRLYENITFLDPPTSVRCSGNLACTVAWERNGFLDGSGLSTSSSNSSCQRGPVQTQCFNLNVTAFTLRGGALVYQLSNRIYLHNGSDCQVAFSEVSNQGFAPAADTLDASNSIVAWEDRRNGTPDIYFARFRRSPIAKIGPDSNLAPGSFASQSPSVAGDRQGTAFFAWTDNRDGNSEIYLARWPEPSASRATVVGTIYDAVTLQPLDSAEVHVVYPDRPAPPQGPTVGTFVAASNGGYRIAGLEPGRYAFSATTPSHASELLSGIELTAGATVTVDLYVHTGTVLRGRVVDAFNGLPIGSASVGIATADSSFVRVTETSPDGRYGFDLLPGTYDISARVPVPGVNGPFFSTARDYYVPAESRGLTVGPLPPPLDFSLTSNAVVLLHGILSGEDSFGTVMGPVAPGAPLLRSAIENAGFHTEGFDRAWHRSIPDQGAELADWFASRLFKSARVVAHSMGGLAARWYLERLPLDEGASRVPLLVTLGTPHHGTALANTVDSFLDAYRAHDLAVTVANGVLANRRVQFEHALLEKWHFLRDLRAGSANLRLLNFGTLQSGVDAAICPAIGPGAHPPELLAPATRYVTFAGEYPQSMLGTTFLALPCPNDGAVPVHSAHLYGAVPPGIANYRTHCLDGYGSADCDVNHFQAFPGDVHYRNSGCVTDNVVRALLGQTVSCPNAVLAASGTPADTTVQALAELDAPATPGVPRVDSVRVTAGRRFGVLARWWRGGLQLSLTSPGGVPLDSAATWGSASTAYYSDYGSRVVRLETEAAEGGTWAITTTLVADSAQNVAIQPYEAGDVALTAAAEPRRAPPGSLVTLSARLESGGVPLAGATVQASVIAPGGGESALGLLDDGQAPDTLAGDGVYSGSYPATAGSGTHVVRVTAAGGTAPAYGPRLGRASFEVAPALDVKLERSDLSWTRLWGYPSDPIVFSATVHNLGDADADSVWVHAAGESLGVAFLDSVIAIPARSSITLGAAFRSASLGLHPLRIVALALGPDPETDYGNNAARLSAEVVAFGGSPAFVAVPEAPRDPPPAPRLASRAFPIPARGGATIEFALPGPADAVRLSVYDAAGRRVHMADLGPRPAGTNRVVWRRAAEVAARARAGIFFYRVEAGGLAASGRIVLIP